jgi:hypothetical protein
MVDGPSNRRAKVTELVDGGYEVEGVVYVAGEPNINGITYTKEALEEVFPRFEAAGFCPVTIGCGIDADVPSNRVGAVIGWSVDGNDFSVKARILSLDHVEGWIRSATVAGIALAGACQTPMLVEDMTVRAVDKILSFGLVAVDGVMRKPADV